MPMRVLVVEDEPLIRLGVATMLEGAGLEVVEAINADQAVMRLEADSSIRLVLTDVDMPGTMDGIRLAHYVSQRWPPIRIIVISGKVAPESGDLPPDARFLSKPYEEPVLLGAIGELIGHADRG
jgi:two-component system, response regulator PdtaR